MNKIVKKFLICLLTFTISFNVISSDYSVGKVNAEVTAAAISIGAVIVACAAVLGVMLSPAAAEKIAPDFQRWLQDNGAEDSAWGRIASGGLNTLAITTLMIRDVREYLLTHGIDAKSGTVAEKTVTISSGNFEWCTMDKVRFGFVKQSGTSASYYDYKFVDYVSGAGSNLQAKEYTFFLAYAQNEGSSINSRRIFVVTKGSLGDPRYMSTGVAFSCSSFEAAKIKVNEDYIKNFNNGGSSWKTKSIKQKVGDYAIYEFSNSGWSDMFSENAMTNAPSITEIESLESLIIALNGDISSSVDLTIPSIGTYDDTNIADLTDGRTLSAADLKAITDALANPYADYKNSDGAITQEDLQNAVTAAIAAALAAAGEKEEPENPSVPDVDISGILDWLGKIYKALTTFFATATSFVTTFPLQRWKETLESFPSITQQITDAIGDIFLTDKSIAETLITFPTAEKLAEWFEGFPATLTNIYDAVTVFPKAIQDGMTDVIQDVFPAALIDALQDALPAIIGAGVASLPLTLVDILIPQLDLSIPKAINGTLPSILQDALKEGIKIPDLKVEFPSLDIPNYMDILAQILAAILSIPSLLTLDVPLIKSAVQSATKDVALETGVEPILALFEDIKFSDDYTYPVITVKTPDILKPYYPYPEIILCDFEKYAEYCLWARNIFRVTLWLAFLYWAAKQLQVKYHIG